MVPSEIKSTLERYTRQASFKNWKDDNSKKHNLLKLADLGFKFSFISGTSSIICSGCQFQPKDLSNELHAISEQHRQFRADCIFNISQHAPRQVESTEKPKCTEVKPSKVRTYDKEFDDSLNYLKNLPRRKNVMQSITTTQKLMDANSSKVVEFYLKKIIEKIVKRLESMAICMGSSHSPDNNTQESASEVPDVSAQSAQLRHMIVFRTESIDEEGALEACFNSRDHDNPFENHNGSLQHDDAGPGFRETINVQDTRVTNAQLEQQFITKLLKMGYKRHHIREAIESRPATENETIRKNTKIAQSEDSTKNSTNRSQNNPDGLPVSPASPTQVSPVSYTHVSPVSYTHVSPVSPTRVSPVSPTHISPTNVSPVSPTHVLSLPVSSPHGSSANVLQSNVSEAFKSASIVDLDGPASFTATCTVSSSSANNGQASDTDISDNDPNVQYLTKESVLAAINDQSTMDKNLARLWTEFEQSTHIHTSQVCLQNETTTVLLPCGHYVCCNTCTPTFTHCCMCRSLIRGTAKALTPREKSQLNQSDKI